MSDVLSATARVLQFGRGVAMSLYCAPIRDTVRLDLIEMHGAPEGLQQTGIADHRSAELSRVFCSLYRSRMLSNWKDLEAHGDADLDARMGKHAIRDK